MVKITHFLGIVMICMTVYMLYYMHACTCVCVCTVHTHLVPAGMSFSFGMLSRKKKEEKRQGFVLLSDDMGEANIYNYLCYDEGGM